MIRNGLFICSIGLLVILYAVNPTSLKYDLLSLTTGVFLLILGIFLFNKGRKNETQNKEKKDGSDQ